MIPVLLYHSVCDSPARGAPWGAVSRAQFAAHVDAIEASARRAITITSLTEALRNERPLPERPVAITFDDGYADTYEAVALLGRRNLTSTVYVTSGQIGMSDRLSELQVSALGRFGGVEIGAHAVRHRRLDELEVDEVAEEVRLSKVQLEQLTGGRVDSFAYPYGCYDGRVRAAVVAAGYRSAAAVKNALCHRADDPFAIGRWTVTADTSAERIADVLEGKRVPLAWTRERLRTRAYRMARRRRRRLLSAGRAPC